MAAKARSTLQSGLIERISDAASLPSVARILAVGVVYWMLNLPEWMLSLIRLHDAVIEDPSKYNVEITGWTWAVFAAVVALPAGMLMARPAPPPLREPVEPEPE